MLYGWSWSPFGTSEDWKESDRFLSSVLKIIIIFINRGGGGYFLFYFTWWSLLLVLLLEDILFFFFFLFYFILNVKDDLFLTIDWFWFFLKNIYLREGKKGIILITNKQRCRDAGIQIFYYSRVTPASKPPKIPAWRGGFFSLSILKISIFKKNIGSPYSWFFKH